MDEITREAVSDILGSTLARIRRAGDMLSPDSPAAHELNVAQRLVEACLQAITGEVPLAPTPSPDGDAIHHHDRDSIDPLNMPLISPLTLREEEVLRLMSSGLHNKEIAAQLGISERTATFHVGNVLAKLGADGRVEAIRIARQYGLI
jgi:DNA-binding CsgD family transcriptional regulator